MSVQSASPSIRVECESIGNGGPEYGVLVVGESWAVGRRLFPDLHHAVSERIGNGAVRVCSIGLSGRNSAKLFHEVTATFSQDAFLEMFQGRPPENAVILNGVNDVIQHLGSGRYADYTNRLVDFLSFAQSVEVISVPRVAELTTPIGSPLGRIKRNVQRYLYDGGRKLVFEMYRQRLAQDFPDIRVIDFDQFIDSFEENEQRYKPDGLHLTPEEYRRYGHFIGSQISLKR